MKKATLVLSLLILGGLGNSAHAQARWCAQIWGEGGRENCHFRTLQQCQASVSGRGGFCRESQYYLGSKQWGRPQTDGRKPRG
jgi:hypothetical protein